MGSQIKWLNGLGKAVHGIAVGFKNQDVLAEVDSVAKPGTKTVVPVDHHKVEVINAKADLDGPAPDGTKEIPGEVKAPAAQKYNSTPGPTGITVGTKDHSPITSLIGTLKVGDKVYPIGSGMKPYSNPSSNSSTVFKKASPGVATITAIKAGKYATIEAPDGTKSFSSLKHYAVVQTPEMDAELFAAHTKEKDALKDAGIEAPASSKWIDALNPAEAKASLPAEQTPAPEAPAAPEPQAPAAPAAEALFDASKSAVGEKVTLPDGEATKTAENTWKIPGKGNSLSDGQVSTYVNDANGHQKPLLDAPAVVEPDVKVSSNHKASPGTVRVQSADDKTPLVVSVASLKVGDKIYPISSLHNKPYGDHGNYNHKGAFVHTENPAGIGEVIAKGSSYATVKGADGNTYYPTNNFVALKSTPGLDAKIDEVKATFDAPENAPEAPAVPNTPEAPAEAPAPVAVDAPAPPAPAAPAAKAPIDISKWNKTGAQMGSNDGGVYTDENGKQWYVKKPASNEHAMNEVLADDLYKAAGIETSNLQLADLGNGKLGTASPMLEGVQKNLNNKLSDKNYKAELQDGFAMDVLLSNWDVVGLAFDNVVTNKDGKPVRVDPGGALLFRAMGAKKGEDFDKNATEWDTLRDSGTNSKSAKAFGDMTDEQLVESAKRVEYLTPGMIDSIVDSSGFDDKTKTELKDKLNARRENIIARAKAITPAEEKADEPIADAPAAPEPAPEVVPEPVTPEPAPEAPQAPEAPAPAPQDVPAPEPAPAPESNDPFASVELKDKGKTVEDSNGDLIKVGSMVTHKSGKNGKGIVTIVLPSTKSAKVLYENGVEQVASAHLMTTIPADAELPDATVPNKLAPGVVFFDSATGKTHIGAKDGTPLTTGDKVSYTKKGVTSEGTVKGIYKGQQTVNIDFTDGTNSTKKAAVLAKLDADSNAPEAPAVDAPAAPEDVTPDVTPEPTPDVSPEPAPVPDNVPEPVPTPEPAPEVAPAPEPAPAEEPTPEVAPEPTPEPAPEETPATGDLSQFVGKLFKEMTPEQQNAVPAGTLLHNQVHGHYWKKLDDHTWKALGKEKQPLGTTIDNHTLMEPSFSALHKLDSLPETENKAPENVPEAPTADVPTPEPVDVPTPEAAPEAPSAPEIQTFDFPDNVTTMPVDTVVPARTGSSVGFKKVGDNKWEMTVQGKGIGQHVDDQFVQGVVDETKPEIQKPNTPEAAPETPAVDEKAPLSEPVAWDGVGTVHAKELPVGSKMSSPSGNWFAAKEGNDVWVSKSGTEFTDEEINDNKEGGYLMSVPDGFDLSGSSDAPVGPAGPGGLKSGDIWGGNANAVDLPLGSSVALNSTILTKQENNKWVSQTGAHYDDTTVDYMKGSSWTYNAPSESSTPAETDAPAEKPTGVWQDSDLNSGDLEVGTTIVSEAMTLQKKAEDKWEVVANSTGTLGKIYPDSTINGLKGWDGWTLNGPTPAEAPKADATPEAPTEDTPEAPKQGINWADGPDAVDAPVGSKIHKGGSYNIIKNGDNDWESSSGTNFSDAEIDNLKQASMAYLYDEPVALEPKAPLNEATLKDVPVDSKVYTGQAGWYATKTGPNNWVSAYGTGYTDQELINSHNDGYPHEIAVPKGTVLPASDAPSAPSLPADGDKWTESTGAKAADLPVGSKVSTSAASLTKIGEGSWQYKTNGGHVSNSPYMDKDIDDVKPSGLWKYGAPEGSAAPAAEPVKTEPVALSSDALGVLPNGTTIVNVADGYTLVKGTASGVNGAWIPQDKNGNLIAFKDGDSWASSIQVSKDYTYFPDAKWNVYPPGQEIPASSEPANASGVVSHKGMSSNEILSLNDGDIMVNPQTGYTLKVKKIDGGGMQLIPQENGQPTNFKDGDYYAASYEVAKHSNYFPDGDWDVHPAGSALPESAPASKAVSHKAMSEQDIVDLENGSILVYPHAPYEGYVLKLQKIGGNTKLHALDKDGNTTNFVDGVSYAAPYEIAKNSNAGFGTGDWNVFPPGTSMGEINGAAPSASSTPSTPAAPATGPVGSAANPAVVQGNKPTVGSLEAYPPGTTLKKESNSTAASSYYYLKTADGNWQYTKKTGTVMGTFTSEQLLGTYGHITGMSTVTVHQPKPYSKYATLGTGEIVYPGQSVMYNGDTGYIKSITNAGKISVQVNGTSGYKAPSKLSAKSTYGLKQHIADTVSGTTGGSSSSGHSSTPSAPDVPVSTATFAGASADEYNAAGVVVKANLNTPKSGLGLVSTGPVDTSNPLHGAPKPAKPEDLKLDKWDSAAWLKEVETRYAAFPNKAKATVQQSNNWNTIQSVLDGHAGSLDKLLETKYIDQALFDQAKSSIEAKDLADKSVKDAHAAKMTDWNTSVEEWMAANPSASQFIDATMPETSKEAFTGGVADWSKAPVGTYSADAALAALKASPENAGHGISVATDSDQIEDLNVKFHRVLDLTGTEVIEVKFKPTQLYAKNLVGHLQGLGAASGNQIYLPRYEKDVSTGLMKDTAATYSQSMASASGKRFEWTHPETGAKVIFNRSSDSDTNTLHTLGNSVRILMPKDSTSADYQKVLEALQIKAKPATAGDIKVFAENKFMTVLGGNHDYKTNFSGAKRQQELDKLKAKFGVTPDDLTFGVDANGDSKLFFTDEAVEKLQKYTKVSGFHHNLTGSGSASEQFFAIITGARPGLLSTYERWGNGVHASGMSSSQDIPKGGGDFVFTKTDHDTSGVAAGGNSVAINPKAALKRIDIYGNSSDSFGLKKTSSGSAYDLAKGSPYEIMFKHSVPVSEWSHLNISGESERQKLIKRLNEHGITKINGIPLENFILTQGMKIPEIDPSFYNVVPS